MADVKERKISFHTLIKRMWVSRDEVSFDLITDVVRFVLKQKRLDKYYDLKESKFCFLHHASIDKDKDGHIVITGFFKSARNKFRPNLVDKLTGDERKSPKKITEGDIEKTHFSIKIGKDEVFVAFEINGNGITINQFVNYLYFFSKKYLIEKKLKKNFSLIFTKIGRGDFLTAVKKMKRARVAEVHFDKSLLGSKCLDFSNRTTSLRRDLVLTATAEKRGSIEETAIDFFNAFSDPKNSISKVRIYGIDENGTEAILDTSFVEKVDSLSITVNGETGELSTTELTTGLKSLLLEFK